MNTTVTTIAGTAIALAAAVTLLAWHGTIDGQATIGFFSGLGVGGVTAGAHAVGVRSGVRATRAAESDVRTSRRSLDG